MNEYANGKIHKKRNKWEESNADDFFLCNSSESFICLSGCPSIYLTICHLFLSGFNVGNLKLQHSTEFQHSSDHRQDKFQSNMYLNALIKLQKKVYVISFRAVLSA